MRLLSLATEATSCRGSETNRLSIPRIVGNRKVPLSSTVAAVIQPGILVGNMTAVRLKSFRSGYKLEVSALWKAIFEV
jgi:hypothetical protein